MEILHILSSTRHSISGRNLYTFLKWGIFVVFGFLFIFNHNFYVSLASKIEDELIGPYQRSNTQLEQLVDVTKKIDPTIIIQDFTLGPSPTKKPIAPQAKPTVAHSNKTISEDELWTALTTYRKAHNKKEIARSDKLCQYARKRAEELTVRLQSKPDDPLDAHAGFKRDADSGYVFEFTGFNSVGENLAYTPGFTTATQVIEWGWDTSSAHRTLQLSDDISHGCISGVQPIYVGVFGS